MAGKQLFANNAKGKLNAGILVGDLQLSLQAGQGALFPAPAGGDWFRATLIRADGAIEIIHCTARAIDNFNPIVRAQEGTIALAFAAGDKVELRWTRDSANQFQQRTDVQRNVARFAGVAAGTADALTATIASDLTVLQDGLRVDMEAAFANLTTAPTLNLTLGATATGALTIKKLNGAALAAGDVAGAGHRLMFEYRAADTSWLLLNHAGALGRSIIAVRQAIQAAALDANGYNSAFAAGAGLAVNLSATATPFNVSFANGCDTGGPFELTSQLTADAASAVSSLASSNTSYLHATWTGLGSVTWSKCLVPPQYGNVFDRTQAALLNFEGANGAVATTDDIGNTWTMTGATLSTAKFKFGTSSIAFGAASKYVECVQFTSLGDGSWEASMWVNWNNLPGISTRSSFFAAMNAAGFGVMLSLFSDAASLKKLELYASSDGTTWNIATNLLGTATVWAVATWYKVRLVFDALAGSYKVFLSNNGAAESTEITLASSARICAISKVTLGMDGAHTVGTQFDGNMDAFRFLRCATNTSAETPSASAPAIGDYPVHFFSIPKMQMFEATAASAVAGVDPTFTQRYRTFAGEVDTGAAAVAAVRNYAIRGEYESALPIGLTFSTINSFAHNIGAPAAASGFMDCFAGDSGYFTGDRLPVFGDGNNGTGSAWGGTYCWNAGRNTAKLAISGTGNLPINGGSGGLTGGMTAARWRLSIKVKRGF